MKTLLETLAEILGWAFFIALIVAAAKRRWRTWIPAESLSENAL